MKLTLIVASLLFATSGFAATTMCRASTAWSLLIKPETKSLEVTRWEELMDKFTIQNTSVRFLEMVPSKIQTTYALEDGYSFTTVIDPKTQKGDGYFSLNGKVVAKYYYCHSS